MTVSVIIPVHNGGRIFRSCLESLSQTQPPPEEILVVADGESDGAWRAAEEFGARAILLPQAGGPARARNRGAELARGDLLFFVDADVTVAPTAISLVRQTFELHPEIAALIGSYDDAPAEPNFLSQYKNLFHHFVHQHGSEEASTFWGACGAIRREVFAGLGGFPETYRYASIEDIDLGYRLKRAGHRIRLVKELQVKHWKRWGVVSLLRADFLLRALPWTELILREGRLGTELNLGWAYRFSVLASFCLPLALAGAVWWQPLLLAAAGCLLVFTSINRALFSFFFRQRGVWFMLGTVFWRWVYDLYCGLAFGIGLTRSMWRKTMRSEARAHNLKISTAGSAANSRARP